MENENHDDIEQLELTPEQQANIEENVRKTLERLDKGKRFWKRIKTPLIIGTSVAGGFILRGFLSNDECPYQYDDEVEEEDYEYEDEE